MDNLFFYNVQAAAIIDGSLDLGPAAPSSSDDTMLRIANTSDIYTAEDVTVRTEGPDSVQLWLSTDGDIFGPEINVGDIGPGGSSLTFYLRRVTPSTASGNGDAYLYATPAAWVNDLESD